MVIGGINMQKMSKLTGVVIMLFVVLLVEFLLSLFRIQIISNAMTVFVIALISVVIGLFSIFKNKRLSKKESLIFSFIVILFSLIGLTFYTIINDRNVGE